jgi:hypothetical protein
MSVPGKTPADLLAAAHEAIQECRHEENCEHCETMRQKAHAAIDAAVKAAYSKGHHDGRGFDPHGGEDA